jgi:GTP cyclohydrolase III
MPSTPAPVVIGGGAVSAGMPVANVGEMDKATEEYVEQVRALNEALQRIAEQTEALGRNMQEMDTLSRNLTGVNAIYEIQLRSAGGQLDAIDKVNEQTKIMAGQVEELNKLYARMIEAMTTNMNRPQL